MDFKVVIIEQATEDLEEIVALIARDNPRAARRMGDARLDTALLRCALPQRGALHDAARGIRKLTHQPDKISTASTSRVAPWRFSISGLPPAGPQSFRRD